MSDSEGKDGECQGNDGGAFVAEGQEVVHGGLRWGPEAPVGLGCVDADVVAEV
jgi:hypothetical protein